MTLSRRNFLQSASGALALGAAPSLFSCAALAQDLKVTTVAQTWISNVEYAGLWIAMEKGYFREEGLEVKNVPGGPNAPVPLVTVAAGKADIGYTNWLPFIDAVGKGNDFVLIGHTFPISPLGILSLAAKPIRKPADIVGAKILAQGPTERTAIEAALALNKLPKNVQFVPAGFSPEPLLSKQGDGYTAFVTNQAITLENMGLVRDKDFFFASFDELGFHTFASGLFTTRQMLQKDRARVVAFMRGLTRGWLDNEKDPTLGPKLVLSKYGVDLGLNPKQQTRQAEVQVAMTRNPKAPTRRVLELDPNTLSGPMYEAAAATGRTGLPPVAQLADFSIMEDVYKTIKR
ncbi:MAG: ABC transporter substrate-binding protein [Gemmatimonadetes bacterium]|nr:ABC transporter substrate-binding protein [Gemmatimonadota bacterium]